MLIITKVAENPLTSNTTEMVTTLFARFTVVLQNLHIAHLHTLMMG
jgi:hypothetical protein